MGRGAGSKAKRVRDSGHYWNSTHYSTFFHFPGLRPEKRDYQEKQGSGPFPDEQSRPWRKEGRALSPSGVRRSNLAPVRLFPDILDAGWHPSVAFTRGELRFLRGVR